MKNRSYFFVVVNGMMVTLGWVVVTHVSHRCSGCSLGCEFDLVTVKEEVDVVDLEALPASISEADNTPTAFSVFYPETWGVVSVPPWLSIHGKVNSQ